MKKTMSKEGAVMLRLYIGSDHKANRDAIFAAVFALAAKGTENQIVVVPEQFSFETQRELCRRGGDTVSRYAEVLSMTYLAERVEAQCGGGAYTPLDRGGRLLAAARAVDAVRDELQLYAAVCRKPSFLSQLLSAIDEFGGYGLRPADLRRFAETHGGQLAQKLTELARIYEAYLAATENRPDAARRLERLSNLLDGGFARAHTFYFYGFADFTAVERAVVEKLARRADVTIALETTSAFAEAEKERWLAFARKRNVQAELTAVPPREAKPSLALLARVFDGERVENSENDGAVQTAVFATSEKLVRAACAETRRLLQSGARASEIAVVCPDTALTPLVRKSFAAAELKLNDTEKRPLSRHSGAKPLLSALEAVTDRMDTLAVLACLRACANEETDDLDRLERYCLKWSVRGAMWSRPFTKHPRGLGKEWTDEDRDLLAKLEEIRARAVQPLLTLRAALAQTHTVRDDVTACYDFLQTVDLKTVLQRQANKLYAAGSYREAMEFVQIYDLLLDALEQTALVAGDCERDGDGFYRLMQTLLGEYAVGTIPSAADAVTFGGTSAVRCASVKHLLVVGATDGAFPAAPHTAGVLTESERAKLLTAGASLAPLRESVAERELAAIRQTVRAATESVWLGTTEKQPSYLFRAACAAFPPAPASEGEIVLNEREKSAARLRRGESADSPEMAALAKKAAYRVGTLSAETVAKLYRTPFSFSATQIETLAKCRFRYFLQYGLHLEKEAPVKFDAPQFGTFVHDVLEQTVRRIMEEGGFAAASDEHIRAVAEDFAAAYEANLADVTQDSVTWTRHFANYLRETLAVTSDLADELRQAQFAPAAEELGFGYGDLPPVEASGEAASCRIRGKVDRVDLCTLDGTTYVRVVDYKTGGKNFEFADVAEGLSLQMLLYLFALKRGGEAYFGAPLKPAGVLYHPAMDPFASHDTRPSAELAAVKSAEQKVRKGVLLASPRVLYAMEPFEDKPRFLPITVASDGSLKGNVMDDRDLEMLERFVYRKVGELCDLVASGVVAPNPLQHGAWNSPCTYCDFADSCRRNGSDYTPRNRKNINMDAFLTMLDEEENAQ